MIVPNFFGPSYTSQSPNFSAQMMMNSYPEHAEMPGAKAAYAAYPCPGFASFSTVAQSPGRGLFATGGLTNRLFGVIGFKLYEYTSDGVAHDRADVDADAYPATFATNGIAGNQMMVTSGGSLYVYNFADDSVAKITTFSGASVPIRQVTYLTDRFIALDATASQYYWSALSDGTSWNLGNTTIRTTAPDPWVSMSVILGRLWLLGTLTYDVYAPTDNPQDPYQPIPGAYGEQGCAAPFSLVNVDSTLVWVGQNANGRGVIWRSNGYAPERISTHAVEFAIQGYSTISDAVAFAYQDQGHSFCVINFPTANATWVYDTTTGLWHQRGYWDSVHSTFLAYRVQYFASAFNENFAQDRSTGTLYTMSITDYSDVDGSVIRRVFRSPHQWDGDAINQVRCPDIQIDMQTGIGLSGAGTPPQVMLNWSSDGGLSYPTELTQAASAGSIGQYGTRVIYTRLGEFRDRVWQLVVTDTVPWRFIQAVYRWPPQIGVS